MREWPADIAAKIVYNIGNRKNHIIFKLSEEKMEGLL